MSELRPKVSWDGTSSGKALASSDLLDSYDIKPGRVYVDGKQVRGYRREQFEEVFERVLAGYEEEDGEQE